MLDLCPTDHCRMRLFLGFAALGPLARYPSAFTACDLRNAVRAELGDDLVQRVFRRSNGRKRHERLLAERNGLGVLHRFADVRSALVDDHDHLDLAVFVLNLFIEDYRERLFDVLQQHLLGAEVQVLDLFFLGSGLEGPLLLGVVGVYQLENRRQAIVKGLFHPLDDGRHLHAHDDRTEEPKLVATERTHHALARSVGDLQGCVDVAQHDRPPVRKLVVHLMLFRGEVLNDLFVLDAFVRKLAGHVQPFALHLACDKLHGRKALGRDRGNEVLACIELGPGPPHAQTVRIRQIRHNRCRRRGEVGDACLGQHPLKLDAQLAHLGCLLLAPLALGGHGLGHHVRLVERDHTVEVLAEPRSQLIDPPHWLLALGRVLLLLRNHVVGGPQNPLVLVDRVTHLGLVVCEQE